jgi:hypothetical protein
MEGDKVSVESFRRLLVVVAAPLPGAGGPK